MDPSEIIPDEPSNYPTQNDSRTEYGDSTTIFEMEEARNGRKKVQPFNPFTERKVDNPTTDFDTLIHLLKAVLGTGILNMPRAFRNSGLFVGVVGTIIMGIISTHCVYILVKCAHILYHKTRRTSMSLPEVAEAAMAHGPWSIRKFSKIGRYGVEVALFISYFGTCSLFAVTAAENIRMVLDEHTKDIFPSGIDERLSIGCLLPVLILLVLIPDLKYLVPVSMLANAFIFASLMIIFWWIFNDFSSGKTLDSKIFEWKPLENFPKFYSITIFAFESVGVIMPIENNMKNPQNFIGKWGVLNQSMFGLVLMHIILGVIGYIHTTDSDKAVISLEMPVEKYYSQIVLILVGIAVCCTLRLLFNVCLEVAWNWIKHRCTKKPVLANYLLRIVLMISCVALAACVPRISPFVDLIGSFCFTIQGFLIPIFIETITYWNEGSGYCKWRVIKNIIIAFTAIPAIGFGSYSAVWDIFEFFKNG